MHPRTTEILTHLDTQSAELQRAVADVPPELRERRPAPDRWAVAEALEHLAVVNASIAKLRSTHNEAARTAGLGPARDTSPVGPSLDVARIVDRSRPVTASEASQPRAGLDANAAMASLAQQQEAFREMVRATDGLALEDVIVPHRVLGPLNIYQWMLFVAGHEGRHAAQIRETAAQLQA